MAIANGIRKSIIFKEETTWGVAASSAGAQVLRRVSGSMNLKKNAFTSNEIRVDQQTADSRHGIRSVDGSLNGELSPGSYSTLFSAMYCKDFVAGPSATALGLTIAVSGLQWTVTRAAGSWLTDSFKTGSVLRLSVGTLNAANINKNLVVTAVTALVITVVPLNGVALVAEGPISNCTASCPGKITMIPQTGHTNKSYTIEEYFSDVSLSHLYTGNRVASANITLPASGLCTTDFTLMGKDLSATGTSQYFTTPTAQTTSGTFADVSGIVILNGTAVAVITNMTINMSRTLSPAEVLGSNYASEIFAGKISTGGSMTMYFQDATMRDMFNNETEFSISVSLATGSSAAADFITVSMGRVKLNGFTITDGDSGLTATGDYVALLNKNAGAGTSGDLTTISMQDSLAA
jgi:hypothetical protein